VMGAVDGGQVVAAIQRRRARRPSVGHLDPAEQEHPDPHAASDVDPINTTLAHDRDSQISAVFPAR